MENVKSREFKRKLNHCKLRIKQWEHNFTKTHGHCPSKDDVEKDSKIHEYYKRYKQLKYAFLESEILGDCFDESCNDSSQLDCSLKENVSNCSQNTPLLDQSSVSIGEDLVVTQPPEGGSTQIVKPPKPRKTLEPKKWMKNTSSKLFEGVSFKLRNPRKALQKKSQPTESTSSLSTTCPSFVSEVSSFNSGPVSPLVEEEVDNHLTYNIENNVSPKIKALIASPASLSPLFGSATKRITVVSADSAPSHPLSILTQSAKHVRRLDAGWVERCSQNAEKLLEEGRVLLDSGFESTSGTNSSPSLEETPATTAPDGDECSDDDFICDSDDEASSQRILTLKRKADKLDFSLNETIAENVVKTVKPEPKKVKFDESIAGPSLTSTPTQLPIVRTASSKQKLNKTDQVKKEVLEKKVQSGTLNENYVKINQKKKVYVRGKKNFNFSKHKKSEWKKKNRDLNAGGEIGGVMRCFKCGDVGHFARYCHAAKEDKLIEVDASVEQECELVSLEEAEATAREVALTFTAGKNSLLHVPQPVEEPTDLPDMDGAPLPTLNTVVPPLNSSKQAIMAALNQFGHTSFRGGQEAAITRILAGKSTLLMLSTGGGKSLCYQLPAFLYHKRSPSIALVVSPLVSLMDDQVSGSLSFFKLGCLHSNQTEKQRAKIVADIEAGTIAALLVSPEAVVSCDSFGFGSVLKRLPPISFACIDEVHCVSQWSYNFRPSYLMLTKVLRNRLNVKTFLGLTATASKSTVASIVKELGIEADGVIQDTPLPSHIHLAVSRVDDKDAALLRLVRDSGGGAIIVYCTRREECVRLATLIRTVLRGVTSEPYHAGLVASKRKSVQRGFMKGKVQVVVATVAFGMGINKQDIRSVFHYNVPKDWEGYVQEVGRAGRDGLPANCHLLLKPDGKDIVELRRHIYSNSVDRHVLRRLLERVFVQCSCQPGTCKGHETAFSVAEIITTLDVPEENISTLLCYLELHQDRFVEVMTPAYMTCRISSYHGARGLRLAAKNCPPLAVALAQAEDASKAASLTFDVIKLARQIGWESGMVKRHLKQTEWTKDELGAWRKTGINVSFSDLGLRVLSKGDLSPEQLDSALEYLIHRVESSQENALALLQSAFSTFYHFSDGIDSKEKVSRSDEIKEVIRYYFKTECIPEDIPIYKMEEKDFDEDAVAADVRHLVLTFRDNTFNGRSVARIMHGIQSPNYPAVVWHRARQWRAHVDKPFNRLQAIATREILKLK